MVARGGFPGQFSEKNQISIDFIFINFIFIIVNINDNNNIFNINKINMYF